MLRALMLYLWRGVTRSGVIINYYVGFCLPTDQSIWNQPSVSIQMYLFINFQTETRLREALNYKKIQLFL